MSVQLTRSLLSSFVENASSKARTTLASSNTLTPFVFANSTLLWLIPACVNHPLRRILGLSTPFIIISGLCSSKRDQLKLVLRSAQTVVCGAEPLASWSSLTSAVDTVQTASQYEYDWAAQRLEPLDRNKARMLTAQYAQILPELCGGSTSGENEYEGDKASELALPMLVFTREIEQAAAVGRPFYLAVFSPGCPAGFANVAAVKHTGTQSNSGTLHLADQSSSGSYSRLQHWAEYDLLGSPAHLADDLADTNANNATSFIADDNGEPESIHPTLNSTPSSYVTLHSVWSAEPKDGNCDVVLPPVPPPSAQWMLELASTPLALEPDSNVSLRALHLELKRLEIWCTHWMSGTKWAGDTGDAKSGQVAFSLHPWQSLTSCRTDTSDTSGAADADTSATMDSSDAFMHATKESSRSKEESARQALQRHRELFGKRVDEFIDTSIYDTRGSTTLGRLGRAKDIHSLSGFPIREDLDFTERLWNLVHYAHDDSDLSEVIAAIAEGLETRKLQPYIHHKGNGSGDTNQLPPLAQLIRDMLHLAQQRTVVDEEAERERLAGQLDLWIEEQPLDAFVYIGLHKLRADFWFYFVAGHLATPRQMEPYLSDEDMEPSRLIAGFWRLLRVLEVWWLIQQAVPGLSRHFASQVVGALLNHFAALSSESPDAADLIEQSEDGAISADAVQSAAAQYATSLNITMFLPLYSSEVQEFVSSVVDGFDPGRYVTAAISENAEVPKCQLIQLTRNPAQIDAHFALSDQCDDERLIDEASAAEDNYTVFEARLF